ncbi:MAG: GNAT family N-acetyltransferase [Candidatus Sabulitectum sp.]|nr:GNAT family N-acetyltransferase [Candidatus Sabulitectum sp.]
MSSVAWPDKFPALDTERLILRQVSQNDSTGLFLCYSDPEVMRFTGSPLDCEDAITGILEDCRDGFGDGYNLIWSIFIRDTGDFAGTAGFEQFSFLDGKAGTGFTLLREYQGAGFMNEALKSILNFGFQELNLNRIQTTVVPENSSSVKLLGKLVFKREGQMESSVFFNNSYHDKLMSALLNVSHRETGG